MLGEQTPFQGVGSRFINEDEETSCSKEDKGVWVDDVPKHIQAETFHAKAFLFMPLSLSALIAQLRIVGQCQNHLALHSLCVLADYV